MREGIFLFLQAIAFCSGRYYIRSGKKCVESNVAQTVAWHFKPVLQSNPMTTSNHSIRVSVIIPLYNTEAYIGEALDSISRQTLRELEIIVVNDGSTDGSLRVVEQRAEKDPRIKVCSQKNAGQSVARNEALKFASGKYLYFMDSDDVIEPETLETCLRKCEEEALDFVFFDADILNKEAELAASLKYNRSGCVAEGEVHTGTVMLQKQLAAYSYTPSPCLNLIRADFMRHWNIHFYPGIIHEDQLFSALLYLRAGRVMYIQQAYFKRRLREASTMTQRFSWRNMTGYLTVTHELLRFKKAEANEEQKQLVDLLLRQMLDAAVWNAHVLPLRQRFHLLRLCLQEQYRRYVSSRTMAAMLAKSIVR